MAPSLPSRPDLGQLKKQAKELRNALKSGDDAAWRRFEEHHPRGKTAVSARKPAPALADAQLILACEHGFANWAALAAHVETLLRAIADPQQELHEAFARDDAPRVRELLEQHPAFKAAINEPVGPFDSPAITRARSRAMLEVLLAAGADINAKSQWWAGGFGVLHNTDPATAAYAIERGARIDVHAAARLGLLDHLRALVTADPSLVHARGGDGQTPLHFAATVDVARFLVEHGADLDAKDVDHESTPAQYMVRDRIEVARFLVERGCQTDLLLATAIGDIARVRRLLDADPACIHLHVDPEHFPMRNSKAGGIIYQWTLGANVSAHDIARERGHTAIFQLLMERSPAGLKLLTACWAGDEALVRAVLAANPDATTTLSAAERRHPALAAQGNKTETVRLMLQSGLSVDARGQYGATPLHWAAFHGNVAMVRTILPYHPPLEVTDADFGGAPLGWAIYGSKNGWAPRSGDYPGVVELLVAAGAVVPDSLTGGTEAVQKVLHRHRAQSSS